MVELPFTISEYNKRMDGVRKGIAERGFDALIILSPMNMYYLTGYDTIGYYTHQFLVVPREGEPFFVTRLIEEMNVSRGTWIKKKSYIYEDDDDPLKVLVDALKEEKLTNKVIGIETDNWKCRMTPYEYKRLEKMAKDMKLRPVGSASEGIVEQCRVIKSKAEVDYIRRAAKIACKAVAAGINAIKEGATENDVAAEVWHTLIKSGCEGPLASQPYVCSGPRSAQTHATYAGRKIQRGDITFFEVGGCLKRYHGAIVRSASLGKPSDKVARIAKLCQEGLDNAIATIRAGITSHEADAACWRGLVKAGLTEYRHRLGYSIGIGYPQGWGEGDIMDLKEGDQRVLKTGMVFHIPGPSIYLVGEAGIGFSETIHVTEDGCEVLSDLDRKLFIV
jgi:Xaa-Pro dipeptidase